MATASLAAVVCVIARVAATHDEGVGAHGVDSDARGVQALQRPPHGTDVRIVDRARGQVRKRPPGGRARGWGHWPRR
jgi:hypothetical protein